MARYSFYACTNRDCPDFEKLKDLRTRKTRFCAECREEMECFGDVDANNALGTDDTPPQSYVDTGRGLTVLKGYLPASTSSSKSSPEPLVFGDTKNADIQHQCDIKGCPIAPSSKPVKIPFSLYHKWLFLCHKFSVEWLAMLTGEETDTEYVLDEDGMYFPVQRVGGAHIDAETCDELPRTIGTIHSHVDMSAYFSSTDYDHFNHPVDMVINRGGKMDCVTRVKLRCGEYQRAKAHLTLVGTNDFSALAAELQSKLIKDTSKSVVVSPTYYKGNGHSSYTPTQSIKFNAEGEVLRSVTELCIHGKRFQDPCRECERLSYTQHQPHGPSAIYRTDMASTQRSLTTDTTNPENPSNKAVEMALKILDRRLHFNHKHGITERLDQLSTD